MAVAAILGSAFTQPVLGGRPLERLPVLGPLGPVDLYVHPDRSDAFVLFRHGVPHRPHQIPWRAQAAALQSVGCGALLLTSSVGLLDPALPLFRPLLFADLLMPDNRLPDGSAATMWPTATPGQGHLVVEGGLFDPELTQVVSELAPVARHGPAPRVVFAYVCGPRTKTSAENRYWAMAGAQVNSMSVGPEVVLANELGIPCAGLGIGHKASAPGAALLDRVQMDASLAGARAAMEATVEAFLRTAEPVPFKNRLHRLGGT